MRTKAYRVMAAFSLIELLIVVAIIAVLAGIAVPLYNSYAIRAKINSIVPVAANLGVNVINYYSRNGSWPDATALGLANTTGTLTGPTTYSPYLAAVTVLNGQSATNCTGINPITYVTFYLSGSAMNASFLGQPGNPLVSGTNYIQWIYAWYTQGSTIVTSCGLINSTTPATDWKYLPVGCQQAFVAPTCS